MAPRPKGRSHIPNPPVQPTGSIPALDGLGQAALNADADELIRHAKQTVTSCDGYLRQVCESGASDRTLKEWMRIMLPARAAAIQQMRILHVDVSELDETQDALVRIAEEG